MKISLITVCFNAEKTIRDTIESVLAQTYGDVEYIVVDGASEDGTVDILRSYGDSITKVVSEPDKGLYDAMNKGFNMASGEVVGTLNADDVFAANDVLQQVASAFKPEVEAVYADLVYVSEDLSGVKRLWKSGEYQEGNWDKGWMPPHPTFYVRREVYQRLGGFDLNLRLAADYELLFRFIRKEKISLAYLPEVTVKMRLGGVTNASLGNVYKQNLEIFSVWEKHQVPVNRFRFAFCKLFNHIAQRRGAWFLVRV